MTSQNYSYERDFIPLIISAVLCWHLTNNSVFLLYRAALNWTEPPRDGPTSAEQSDRTIFCDTISLLDTRMHCWLIFNLKSTRTPRFSGCVPAGLPSACTEAWGSCSQVQDGSWWAAWSSGQSISPASQSSTEQQHNPLVYYSLLPILSSAACWGYALPQKPGH